MKLSGLLGFVVLTGCVLIVGCSRTAEPSRLGYTPNINSTNSSKAGPLDYGVLHSFGGHDDGSRPNSLVMVGERFYGTTRGGGASSCDFPYSGCGTVFSITTDGRERVLHKFGLGKDGNSPVAGLIYSGGVLYGTTEYGGAHGMGTVFSITPSGKERVVYSFGLRPDAENPTTDLIDVAGTLYGTTFGGGNGCGYEGCGTVYSVTKEGRERVLHRFENATKNDTDTDGYYPDAGLVDAGGLLYGTTYQGGTHEVGIVFSITRSGKETVLYNFTGIGGGHPAADLLDVEGTLYGTTQSGGPHSKGTVFSVTTDGKERVLHAFNVTDGSQPSATLIEVKGTLYGTTQSGGTNSCGPYGGCGTVFTITKGGREKVLHSFGEGTGYLSAAALVYKSGILFGTTQLGGPYGRHGAPYGGGAVFSLTP